MARLKSPSLPARILTVFALFLLLTAASLVLLRIAGDRSARENADVIEAALRQALFHTGVSPETFDPILKKRKNLAFGLVLDADNRPFLAWETRDPEIKALLRSDRIRTRIESFRREVSVRNPGTGWFVRSFTAGEYRVLLLLRTGPFTPVAVGFGGFFLLLFVLTALLLLLRSAPRRVRTLRKSGSSPLFRPEEKSVMRPAPTSPPPSADLEKLSFFREIALATNALGDLSSMLKALCGVFAAKFPERNVVFYLNAGTADELLRPVTGLIGGRQAEEKDLVRAGYEETDMDSAWKLCEDRSDSEKIRVPLKDEETLYGFILLEARGHGGEKPDLEEIHFVSRQVALAVRNSALYREAITDGLTGLFVHKYFQMKMEEELRRFRRTGRPFSVFLMDIDNFKRFNDNFGHQAGDHVLRELASLIRASIRSSDLAFRYGGEEMAVLLPETEIGEGLLAAEKIRKTIAEHAFIYEAETVLKVTVSGGVFAAAEGLSVREIVEACDKALYRAKAEGKNRVLEGKLEES